MASWQFSRHSSLARTILLNSAREEISVRQLASLIDAPLPLPLRRRATAFRVPSVTTSSDVSRCAVATQVTAFCTFRGVDVHRFSASSQPPLPKSSFAFPPRLGTLTECLPPLLVSHPARGFRLTPPYSALPLPVLLLAKKAVNIISILVARFARNRYRGWSDDRKARFREWLARRKHWFLLPAALLTSVGVAYILVHLERTPYTSRLRLLTLTDAQSMELQKMELTNLLAEHGPNFVDEKSRDFLNLRLIMDNIIRGNRDVPAVSEVEWKLHLVDRKDVQNAFVLATGDIFFFTGILKKMENNDEIACIMGHEMAHHMLRHDVEKGSLTNILDLLVIGLTSIIWFIIPDDIVAIIVSWISDKFVRMVGELPYSRMLEEEADLVGLEIAAKACYDVRASSNIWTKLYVEDKLSEGSIAGNQLEKYFSTHPLDCERADKLDVNIPAALQLRKSCSCPPLPHVDPRNPYYSTRKLLDTFNEDELESVREAQNVETKAAIMREIFDKKQAEKVLAEKAAEEERQRLKRDKELAVKMAREKAAAAVAEAEAAAAEKGEMETALDASTA